MLTAEGCRKLKKPFPVPKKPLSTTQKAAFRSPKATKNLTFFLKDVHPRMPWRDGRNGRHVVSFCFFFMGFYAFLFPCRRSLLLSAKILDNL